MGYGYGSFAGTYLESALIGATKLDARMLIPIVGPIYLKEHDTSVLADVVVYTDVAAQVIGLVVAVVGTALWLTTPPDPPKPGDRPELTLLPWVGKDASGLVLTGTL